MAETLRKLLTKYDNTQFATQNGTEMHRKMRALCMKSGALVGDTSIVENINKRPELLGFFGAGSMAEVPVAAIINGKFVSRRIDRMVVDDKNRIVHIIDYKTDTDKAAFRSVYVVQVQEYISIIKKIYPKYRVCGYILWLHDWTLEKL
ncbi:MAG: hypothetical protein J5679_02285 [Alphaproteobacteria bacterium]|nr:hypothetical protein [Alphaproteobacteria bacterium]